MHPSREVWKSLLRLALPLTAAVLLLVVGLGAVSAQQPFHLWKLTSGQRDSDGPSLNSTGSKLAFFSDSDFLNQGDIDSGEYEVWLYDRASMALTRVTTAVPDDDERTSWWPSISADGSRIAFESDSDFLNQGILWNQFEIWLFDTTTMALTRVTTATEPDRPSVFPSISGDGSKIAFSSASDFLAQGDIPFWQAEIWLYDTATMTVTRLTRSTSVLASSESPSANMDGSKIAFSSDADFLAQGNFGFFQKEIWLYDTATMTVTRITTANDEDRLSDQPSISDDGTRIAFVSDADFLGQGIPIGQEEIWLYDTTAMTLTRITTATAGADQCAEPSISGDGTRIAFVSDSDFLGQGISPGQYEVWLYDTKTMTLTRVTTATTTSGDTGWPSLNRDGEWLAFASDSNLSVAGLADGADSNKQIWLAEFPVSKVYLPALFKPVK